MQCKDLCIIQLTIQLAIYSLNQATVHASIPYKPFISQESRNMAKLDGIELGDNLVMLLTIQKMTSFKLKYVMYLKHASFIF